jgi:sortase A
LTENTILAPPPAASPPPRRPHSTVGDKIRFFLRGVGQTLITLGMVVLLFVAYEVWITNLFAARAQQKVTNALKEEWRNDNDPLPLPGEKISAGEIGKGIAVLYIPRLGRDYHFTIVEGSTVPTDGQLEKGPAHYRDTQLPGQVGNFAVAGHRVGKGEPFLNLDKLKSHDVVIVETKSHWYVYRVLNAAGTDIERPDTTVASDNGVPIKLPGREIVDPSDGQVLFPVPDHGGVPASEPLMTMTTCHPKFTASHRMIVYARLALTLPNRNLTMPPAVQALYSEVKI